MRKSRGEGEPCVVEARGEQLIEGKGYLEIQHRRLERLGGALGGVGITYAGGGSEWKKKGAVYYYRKKPIKILHIEKLKFTLLVI
jgi:hypothetical protein